MATWLEKVNFHSNPRKVKVKVAQSCLTLCDPMGYTVHGILQAGILEWVAFPSFRRSSQPRDQTQVSHIARQFCNIGTTREAQEYWSGYPIPSPGDLLNPGIELGFPALQADSLSAELQGSPVCKKAALKGRCSSLAGLCIRPS